MYVSYTVCTCWTPLQIPTPAPLRSRYAWFLASSKPLLHSTEASLAQGAHTSWLSFRQTLCDVRISLIQIKWAYVANHHYDYGFSIFWMCDLSDCWWWCCHASKASSSTLTTRPSTWRSAWGSRKSPSNPRVLLMISIALSQCRRQATNHEVPQKSVKIAKQHSDSSQIFLSRCISK